VIINQGIYGTVISIGMNMSNSEKELTDVIEKIIELKKQPFTDIYVKIPSLLFQKFLDKLALNGLKYKESEIKKQIFMLKF
jgi:hypothetical protein